MTCMRKGMALPAAIAAVIILAGVATLANISATAAIRESRALRDVAFERLQRDAMRVRALYQVGHRPRSALIGGSIAVGTTDTTLVTNALAWPWHTVTVTVGGMQRFAEFARATVPGVPWCSAVVYADAADVGDGTLVVPPPAMCADRLQIGRQLAASFDSALVAGLMAIGNTDTLTVFGAVNGVVRATRSIVVAGGANVAGLLVAPVVRIVDGARVRGMVVARDSLSVAPGSLVTADSAAVFDALRAHARLVPLGRRGQLILP